MRSTIASARTWAAEWRIRASRSSLGSDFRSIGSSTIGDGIVSLLPLLRREGVRRPPAARWSRSRPAARRSSSQGKEPSMGPPEIRNASPSAGTRDACSWFHPASPCQRRSARKDSVRPLTGPIVRAYPGCRLRAQARGWFSPCRVSLSATGGLSEVMGYSSRSSPHIELSQQ